MKSLDALFAASRSGEKARAGRLLGESRELGRVTGPHPIWGREPTALHVAVENGRADVAALLLKSGVDPNHASDQYDGWTPLLIAAGRESRPLVDLLMAHGANVDAWEAAALGDVVRLGAIIAADAAVTRERRADQAPPLHFAATVEVASLLVEHGAPLGALDKFGSTAARAAAYGRRSRRPVARYLVERSGERDPWMLAALDDVDGLESLAGAGLNVVSAIRDGLNPAGGWGEMPIHTAASLGNLHAVKVLLARGAGANAVAAGARANGARPLHYAAKLGSRAVVETLMAAGADPRLRDSVRQGTASDWARFFGHFDLAEFLETAES
jgi:ankyrin repeat protein